MTRPVTFLLQTSGARISISPIRYALYPLEKQLSGAGQCLIGMKDTSTWATESFESVHKCRYIQTHLHKAQSVKLEEESKQHTNLAHLNVLLLKRQYTSTSNESTLCAYNFARPRLYFLTFQQDAKKGFKFKMD